MAALKIMVGMVTVGIAQAGIYPDGHWDYATKITTDNADSFVKENVDAGKTAPNWNKVADSFKANPDVVFGDVSLSSDQVRTIHGEGQNPGAGGWPTVRHFNKETGYGGKAYVQKTKEAMCDELGPKHDYMQQHVEEAGGASLCDINNTDQGCSDKQKDFIEKWKAKPADEIKKQFDRLKGMAESGSSMKPEAAAWMKQRVSIYKQLTTKLAKEEL